MHDSSLTLSSLYMLDDEATTLFQGLGQPGRIGVRYTMQWVQCRLKIGKLHTHKHVMLPSGELYVLLNSASQQLTVVLQHRPVTQDRHCAHTAAAVYKAMGSYFLHAAIAHLKMLRVMSLFSHIRNCKPLMMCCKKSDHGQLANDS